MAAAAAAGRGAGEPRAVPEARTREPRVGKRRARAAGRLSQWGLRFVACHADSWRQGGEWREGERASVSPHVRERPLPLSSIPALSLRIPGLTCLFLSLRGLGFCLFLSVSQTGWLYYYC